MVVGISLCGLRFVFLYGFKGLEDLEVMGLVVMLVFGFWIICLVVMWVLLRFCEVGFIFSLVRGFVMKRFFC